MLDLHHLRCVIVLSEELHFGKAAERLFMTQPPLSRLVQQLETELGTKLFNRTKRRVEITEAGTTLVNEGRHILGRFENVVRLMAKVNAGETGHIGIGFVSSADVVILTEILKSFTRDYPSVDVELLSMSSSEQVKAFLSGRIQVGLVRLPVTDPRLTLELVKRERLIVAMPAHHRLAGLKQLPLRALKNETLILFPRTSNPGYYDFIIKACRGAGFNPDIVREADNLYTGLALVAAGRGISLIPACVRKVGWGGVVYADLRRPVVRSELAMAYLANQDSRVLDAFLRVTRKFRRSVSGVRGKGHEKFEP